MFRVHLKPKPPVEYRSAYQNPDETECIDYLVNYLYDRGFMMINTCSAALSTAITTEEVDRLAETMEAGLKALVQDA
jgi:glutamate-1-semialdehyde 2,1-aminomutase